MLVLIAGITGQLGHRLAVTALGRDLSVRGLGRDRAKLERSFLEKLESFVTSSNYYDVPALDKAVKGVDAVICAYSPSPILDLDGHLLLLRAAERAGVKIFVASSWNCDWTKIKFGDLEPYDNHIAFEQQAAMTSSINPVYLFTGVFHSLLFTPYGPGGLDTADSGPKLHYWGDGDQTKHPWTHMDDAVAWTIEVLINGDGVRDGNGGFFSFRSGRHTIRELARAYQDVTGTEVQIVRQGNLEDLRTRLARERAEKGRERYFEYLPLASALVNATVDWEMNDPTVLDHIHAPTTLESALKERFESGSA